MTHPTPDPDSLPVPLQRGQCANCGAPMHGPYCAACGQSAKGLIRHLGSVLADAGEALFNIDSRVFRSIVPLYARPGFLTLEYFSGRRMRYVTPFRLFFFLCILSFFAIQFTVNLADSRIILLNTASGQDELAAIRSAPTLTELDRRSAVALEAITREAADPAERQRRIDRLHDRVASRGAWLQKRDDALAAGTPPPKDPEAREFTFNGKPWDPVNHPVEVAWLPAFANRAINASLIHLRDNLVIAERDPAHLFAGVFSVLPQALFVLLPLFALLLKVMFLFKRRLYMEHLMVALHSHAFICLSLLLLALLELLIDWAESSAPALAMPLHWLRVAMWAWLPVYLLLMQKRVYAQGWPATLLKYWIIGVCYITLLAFTVASAMLVSLASA